MKTYRSIEVLDTHHVTNQPPPLQGFNRFRSDRAPQDAVKRAGAECHYGRLEEFGNRIGSARVIEWGEDANRNPPVLETHDRFGHRIDEVRFYPSYHNLMSLGLDVGVATFAQIRLQPNRQMAPID